MCDDAHNPIVAAEELRFRRGRFRPVALPGVAHVFVDRRGQMFVADGEATRSVGDWIMGRPQEVYGVKIGERRLEFCTELPCKANASLFLAHVRLAYRVSDPTQVVRGWITDVCAEIKPWVEQRMADITGDYDVLDRRTAERKVNDELGSGPQPSVTWV